MPKVVTSAGAVGGRWDEEVASFLGIPYAAPPLGELRFAAPAEVEPWEGVRPADQPAAAPIQDVARQVGGIGPLKVAGFDEVNVWTPSPGTEAKLPVMVWIHGGGFNSGAGSADCYSGETLARRGNVVAVGINYRLGALGYLYLGEEGANFGFSDQLAALRWVHENIERFGGDPDNVTLFGQSAGAHSIVSIASLDSTAGLYRRVILQSLPAMVSEYTLDHAAESTRIFLEKAGIPNGGLAELRQLPVSELLRAQLEMSVGNASVLPQLLPVPDGLVLPRDPIAAMYEGSLGHVDVMAGFTADEGLFWARGKDIDRALAIEIGRPFGESVVRLAARQPIHLFYWRRPCTEELGACHCAELPFVFNNFDDWQGSPLLAGNTAEELAQLADQAQDAWISFATNGDPQWPGYELSNRVAMAFDCPSELVTDPGGCIPQ